MIARRRGYSTAIGTQETHHARRIGAMNASPPAIKVGISSCLLGQPVRYDGGHKLSMLCTVELARHFSLIPACPEAGAGLGIPRPAIQLTGDPAAPRAVQVLDPREDVTDSLLNWSARQLPHMRDLCGYIFIRNSPSCGMFRVKVHQHDASAALPGRGLFAAALTRAMPLLPVEEEGRLRDTLLRENFIARVHIWHNWRLLRATGLTLPALHAFHANCRYSVMACSPGHYRKLKRLLDNGGDGDADMLGHRYITALMTVLQYKATRRSNACVLVHLQRCLQRHAPDASLQDAAALIENYRRGTTPLAEPAAWFHQHLQNCGRAGRQTFLQPYAGHDASAMPAEGRH